MIGSAITRFDLDRERRAKLLAVLALILFSGATFGVVTADGSPQMTVATERPSGNTLIALQGYQDEGRVIEVSPDGEVIWKYTDGHDFFDVERLGPDRIQLAVADELPDEQCPPRFRDDGFQNCVRNSLRIVDYDTKETRWEYSWYDAKLHAHELHDADHYTVDGEDRWVLVDMGNNRVFAVDRNGTTQWQWNATDTYERPSSMGPEGDWTHMNDVDRVRPGVFQVSLRNFDTVVELHVSENGSVSVAPVVGPNSFDGQGDVLYEQHNPDRLRDGSLLVADSENDRIVELSRNGTVRWEYGGSAIFNWPRDADRLENGHTLITDSYNDRVVEVDENGDIVWAVETGRLPYEADRSPERNRADARPANEIGIPNRTENQSVVGEYGQYGVAMAKYVLPARVANQVYPILGGLIALAILGVDLYRGRK